MNEHRSIGTFQSRLGMIQDNLKRKLIDATSLYWISSPVDCIRLRVRKTFEGDDAGWIVEKCDIVSAVFPPLDDVPYRKINVDEKTRKWSLTSLISAFEDDAQDAFYTLQIPFEYDINVGDLLFRILIDEAQQYPIIIPIQVQEMLGTFGMHKIIQNKCKCTIPTDTFPQEIVDAIQEMAIRRQIVRY